MKTQNRILSILITEDNPDDCLLIERAFAEINWTSDLFFVSDGLEMLQFLRKEGQYLSASRPDLILLDLNMPRLDGRTALAEIKADPDLRSIPVVVLTNSSTREDIRLTYDLGGAGFIVKPLSFEGMLEVVTALNQYWFEVVELANGVIIKNGRVTLPPSNSALSG